MKTLLQNLSQHLTSHCPFFQSSYPFAFVAGGRVWQETAGGDWQEVFLQDAEANYFYLRVAEPAKFAPQNTASSCRKNYTLALETRLVAVVKNADRYRLFDWLQTALALFPDLTLKSVTLDAQKILETETGQKQTVDLKNLTLLAFDFTLQLPVFPDACLPPVCHVLLC